MHVKKCIYSYCYNAYITFNFFFSLKNEVAYKILLTAYSLKQNKVVKYSIIPTMPQGNILPYWGNGVNFKYLWYWLYICLCWQYILLIENSIFHQHLTFFYYFISWSLWTYRFPWLWISNNHWSPLSQHSSHGFFLHSCWGIIKFCQGFLTLDHSFPTFDVL